MPNNEISGTWVSTSTFSGQHRLYLSFNSYSHVFTTVSIDEKACKLHSSSANYFQLEGNGIIALSGIRKDTIMNERFRLMKNAETGRLRIENFPRKERQKDALCMVLLEFEKMD